jgi:Flp pilus assembly protein TadD
MFSMGRESRIHVFPAASVAVIIALTGCASRSPDLTVTDDTRTRLAQALQASGDPTNAAILRDQTAKKAGQAADPLTHATALIAAGETDQGINEAKAALAAHGDNLTFSLEVGRLAVRAGRLAEARDVYQQISLRHPDSVEALNGKGVVLAQQGNLSGAAEAFRKALALRPQDVPARNNLALAMLLSGEVDVARAMLEDLDRSDGSSQVKATLALARERSRTPVASQLAAFAESTSPPPRTPVVSQPAAFAEGSSSPPRAPAVSQPAALAGSSPPPPRAPVASQPIAFAESTSPARVPVASQPAALAESTSPPPRAPAVRQPTALAESTSPLQRAPTVRQPAAFAPSTSPSLRAPTAMLSPTLGERRIVLRASAFAWIQVRDAAGQVLLDRELRPDETWPVPNRRGLVFTTGNAGGTELVVDGVATASLGGLGVIRRNVPLDPDLIKDGKLPTQISVARAAVSPVSSQGLSGPP